MEFGAGGSWSSIASSLRVAVSTWERRDLRQIQESLGGGRPYEVSQNVLSLFYSMQHEYHVCYMKFSLLGLY